MEHLTITKSDLERKRNKIEANRNEAIRLRSHASLLENQVKNIEANIETEILSTVLCELFKLRVFAGFDIPGLYVNNRTIRLDDRKGHCADCRYVDDRKDRIKAMAEMLFTMYFKVWITAPSVYNPRYRRKETGVNPSRLGLKVLYLDELSNFKLDGSYPVEKVMFSLDKYVQLSERLKHEVNEKNEVFIDESNHRTKIIVDKALAIYSKLFVDESEDVTDYSLLL